MKDLSIMLATVIVTGCASGTQGADVMPKWLAIFVAVATILSAIFAYRSARSAKKQAEAAQNAVNEAKKQGALNKAQLAEMKRQSDIYLHSHRLEVYQAFTEFRFEIKFRASSFNRDKLGPFYTQALLSEFYFDPEISTALYSSVEKAVQLKAFDDQLKNPQEIPLDEKEKLRKEASKLVKEIDDALDVLDKDIRKSLILFTGA